MSSGIHLIKLELAGAEDPKLQQLTEYIRGEITNVSNILANLGYLMLKMAQDAQSEKFYRLALDDPAVLAAPKKLSPIYNKLGWIYNETGKFEKAAEFYKNSFAMDQKALDIELNSAEPNQSLIATIYNNTGLVYKEQEKYAEALDMYKKARDIQFDVLPHDHPNNATGFHNISDALSQLGHYSQAIEYMHRAIGTHLHLLPPTHPLIANACLGLSMTHFKKHEEEHFANQDCNHLELALEQLKLALTYQYCCSIKWQQKLSYNT